MASSHLLDKDFENALVKLESLFRLKLSLDGIISRLEKTADDGFMTQEEKWSVEAKTTDSDKVSKIIFILRKKDNEAFERFRKILRESGNDHLDKELGKAIEGERSNPSSSEDMMKTNVPAPQEHARGLTDSEDKALKKLKPYFVVMTANENEHNAAQQYLKQPPDFDFFDKKMGEQISKNSDPSLNDVKEVTSVRYSTYEVFEVAGMQGILMRCTKMGSFTRKGSNWHTFQLLKQARDHGWPLKVIFIVGCCGAHTKKEVPITEGTVLVAEFIEQYSIGKMEADGMHYEFNHRLIKMKKNWIRLFQESKSSHRLPMSNKTYTIEALEHIDMCSGDFVIKNDDIARQLCGDRNKIGFEMEGLGVISAIDVCNEFFPSEKGQPDVIIVKGVSDTAGGDKNKPKTCRYFSEEVAMVDEKTRQHMCTVMSLTLVLRALIKCGNLES
jgi:hypothetical protein